MPVPFSSCQPLRATVDGCYVTPQLRSSSFFQIKLPSAAAGDNGWTIGKLLVWIRENILKERPELFLKDAAATCDVIDVRPGILVLVSI